MKQTEFKTRRLVLRAFKISDYPVWFDAYTRRLPKKSKWDFDPMDEKKCSLKIFKKIVSDYKRLAKEDDYYRYALFCRKSGALIGHIDFDVLARHSLQMANFGYQIHNKHWRKGYAYEATKIGLMIGFKELKLHRLEAAINLDHVASIGLVKKLGMSCEGVRRGYWYENGDWEDHLIYSALPEDVGLKSIHHDP